MNRASFVLFSAAACMLFSRPGIAAPIYTFAEGETRLILDNAAAGTLLICEAGDSFRNNNGTYSCGISVGGVFLPRAPSDTVTFTPANGATQIKFCSEVDAVNEPDKANDLPDCKLTKDTTGNFAITEPAGQERMTEKMAYNPIMGQPGYGLQGSNLLTYELISDTPKPKPGKQNEGQSGGPSVSYDATLQVLSFANDHMTDTGFPGDPILGASVNVPDLVLVGLLNDGTFLFSSDPSASTFTIATGANVFLQAQLPILSYVPDDNLFVGALTDLIFSNLGSPWIATMASIFNPSSPVFDRDSLLWFSYSPSGNMLSLTGGFSASAVSSGTNLIFSDIPEPSSIYLLAIGLFAVLRRPDGGRWRRAM